MRAINIHWYAGHNTRVLENLPDKVDLPDNIRTVKEANNWLLHQYGPIESFDIEGTAITLEMKMIAELEKLMNLAQQISDEVYDDGQENGTGGILNICDCLVDKIETFLGDKS